MLSPEVFDAYLEPLTAEQSTAIRGVRELIQELAPGLVEAIDDGKWFRGLLTYHTADRIFAYALGPRSGRTTFHMMPFYGSGELQSRHGAALKPFLTGKSCIRFRTVEELPLAALRDIVGATERCAQVAREIMVSRKK